MSTSVSRSFFSFVPPRRYVAALSTAFCIGVGFCSGECSSTFSWLLLLVLSSASCASSSCSSSSCSCGSSLSALSVGAFELSDDDDAENTLGEGSLFFSALLRSSSSPSSPLSLLFFVCTPPRGRSGAILGFTGITLLSVTYSASARFNRSGISGTRGKSFGTFRRPSNINELFLAPLPSPPPPSSVPPTPLILSLLLLLLLLKLKLKAAIARLDAPPIKNLGLGSNAR